MALPDFRHRSSKMNAAFFTMNGVISVVFFAFIAGDLFAAKIGVA